jgi:hypothetical protein
MKNGYILIREPDAPHRGLRLSAGPFAALEADSRICCHEEAGEPQVGSPLHDPLIERFLFHSCVDGALPLLASRVGSSHGEAMTTGSHADGGVQRS